MSEETTQGCEEFVTRVLAASTRKGEGTSPTRTDRFPHDGDLVKFELTKLSKNGWRLCAWTLSGSAFQQAEISRRMADSLEFGARAVWKTLEEKRARVIVNPSMCDGGRYACDKPAVWAFRINPEDTWLYACGRHLTFSLTEESGGEQAEFIVRRIKTEER